MESKTYLQ